MIDLNAYLLLLFLAAGLSGCEEKGTERAKEGSPGLTHYTGTIRLVEDSILLDLSWRTPPSPAGTVEYSIGSAFRVTSAAVDREDPRDKVYRLAADTPVRVSYTIARSLLEVRQAPELLELSHLDHWLPRPAADRYRDKFTYALTVHHDAAIYAASSGREQIKENATTLVRSARPTTMATLILSAREPRHAPARGEGRVSYVSYLTDRETEETVRTVERVVEFYASIVDDRQSMKVKCLILPASDRPGAGNHSYVTDDGAMRITNHDDPEYTTYVIAHEAAHLLWNRAAGANTSPDAFLNESFAEYFSWLFVRDTFGQQRYTEIVEKNRLLTLEDGKLSSVSSTRPWRENQRLLYNKGAYLLSNVHDELGDERFYDWLRMILKAEPATVAEFIRLLAADTADSPSLAKLSAELRE